MKLSSGGGRQHRFAVFCLLALVLLQLIPLIAYAQNLGQSRLRARQCRDKPLPSQRGQCSTPSTGSAT